MTWNQKSLEIFLQKFTLEVVKRTLNLELVNLNLEDRFPEVVERILD
jgi:hypothetical protein